MTAVTVPRMPAQFLRPLPQLVRLYLVPLAWFAGIVLALWIGAVVVMSLFTTVDVSMAQFARQGSTWFPFSIAISTLSSYIAVHIAAGLTRRSLIGTTLAISAIMSVLVSAFVVILFGVERLVYDANGWSQGILDNGWFVGTAQDLPAIFGWHLLNVAVAQISGLLVATVFLRYGALRGTIALPLTVGPLVAFMVVISWGVDATWLITPVRIGIAVALAIAMAASYAALIRGLQLRPPSA